MFSLMSLYFAYRRNVVVAERHIPALAQAPAERAVTVQTETAPARELPLAA